MLSAMREAAAPGAELRPPELLRPTQLLLRSAPVCDGYGSPGMMTPVGMELDCYVCVYLVVPTRSQVVRRNSLTTHVDAPSHQHPIGATG